MKTTPPKPHAQGISLLASGAIALLPVSEARAQFVVTDPAHTVTTALQLGEDIVSWVAELQKWVEQINRMREVTGELGNLAETTVSDIMGTISWVEDFISDPLSNPEETLAMIESLASLADDSDVSDFFANNGISLFDDSFPDSVGPEQLHDRVVLGKDDDGNAVLGHERNKETFALNAVLDNAIVSYDDQRTAILAEIEELNTELARATERMNASSTDDQAKLSKLRAMTTGLIERRRGLYEDLDWAYRDLETVKLTIENRRSAEDKAQAEDAIAAFKAAIRSDNTGLRDELAIPFSLSRQREALKRDRDESLRPD